MVVGALCLLLAIGLEVGGHPGAPDLVAIWREHLMHPTTRPALDASWLWLGQWAAALGLVVGLAVLSATVATGGWGPLDLRERRRFGAVVLRPWPPVALVLGLSVLVATVVVHTGVLAGAARAVDASQKGLSVLWWSWIPRVLWGTGCILIVAGAIELALLRRRRWLVLHQSPREARQEQRTLGSARR